MNIVKARFVNGSAPTGREYTYYSAIDVAVGDLVELHPSSSIGSKPKGIITQINVPEAEIEPFKDRAKTIYALWVEEETEQA